MSSDVKAHDAIPSLPARHESDSSINEKEHPASSSDSDLDVVKEEQGVDVTVDLISGHIEEHVDPAAANAVLRKLDWHMLPILCLLYFTQFMDKNSLANSSVLGLLVDTHLNQNEYNNLTTAFYLGYLIFILPHAYAMQKFPISKWIGCNIFMWAIFLGVQPAVHNYGAMFGLRFLLGASEGCITTGIMTILQMFYTRVEIVERTGWVFMCNGLSLFISGFISYGFAHIKPGAKVHPWMWFMILVTILSLVVSSLFLFIMPDNPAKAKFLTQEEKITVVKRLRSTQNGIETKTWKRSQFIEAFKDPLAYFFFFYAAVVDLQGGVGIEYGQILKGMGFSKIQTTILNVPSGMVFVIAIILGAMVLRRFPNTRTILAPIAFMPGVLGCLILIFLPSSNKVGLLVQFYIIQTSGLGMVMMLSLCNTVVSGHTKKMTMNAIFFVGYCLGQMVSTQFWKTRYAPRFRAPWGIMLSSYAFCILLIIAMRFYLIHKNKVRDAELAASGKPYEEFGYVEHVQADGSVVKYKVPIQYMDLTDWENKSFRYPL